MDRIDEGLRELQKHAGVGLEIIVNGAGWILAIAMVPLALVGVLISLPLALIGWLKRKVGGA